MSDLSLFIFNAMNGLYTTGLLGAVAQNRHEAIESICQRFRQDEIIREKIQNGDDDGENPCDVGTWKEHLHLELYEVNEFVNELRTQLQIAEVKILPIEAGVAFYSGGGD